MNSVFLVGRPTKNIELRKTSKGKSVCRFTLACNRDKDNADFVPVIAWDKTAENVSQYVSKGDVIGVEGRITTYSTGDGNNKQWHTEVVASRIKFIKVNFYEGTKPQEANTVQYTPSPDDHEAYGIPVTIDSSDLPF